MDYLDNRLIFIFYAAIGIRIYVRINKTKDRVMDIFTTSLAASHSEMMRGRAIDGVNLLPYLFDSISQPPHEYLFWQRGISKVLRSNEWKLMINEYSDEALLYKLSNDKYETTDVSNANPDVVGRLKKVHKNWQKTHIEPMWPSVIYYTAEMDGRVYYFEQ